MDERTDGVTDGRRSKRVDKAHLHNEGELKLVSTGLKDVRENQL